MIPRNYEEFSNLAAMFREEAVRRSKGQRWCWIVEWIDDEQVYRLGAKYEGQTTWDGCTVVQNGLGITIHDWLDRLNSEMGISPDDHRQILNSGGPSARAFLHDDEDSVVLQIRGTPHHSIQDPSSQFESWKFTLEIDDAIDLFRGLHVLSKRFLLPEPAEDVSNIQVVDDIDSPETTFWISGDYEVDPLDQHCFTLTIDLQTAANLWSLVPDDIMMSILMLTSPEDILGER